MNLADLNPRWVGAGGTGISDVDGNPIHERHGIGMTFDCPCGKCGVRGYVAFSNPNDGYPPVLDPGEPSWSRTGFNFESLTLTPSIHRVKEKGGCGWHGFITGGKITTC